MKEGDQDRKMRALWSCMSQAGLGSKLCMFITQLWKSMFLVARISFNLSSVYVQLVSRTIYHELNTNTTKTIQTKSSNPFTILFHQTLHPYNKIFVSSEGVFKGHKHPLIY
jgi:hypothetical protein